MEKGLSELKSKYTLEKVELAIEIITGGTDFVFQDRITTSM